MHTAVSRASLLGKNLPQNMGNIVSLLEVNPTVGGTVDGRCATNRVVMGSSPSPTRVIRTSPE